MPSKPILVGAALTACAIVLAEPLARACGCFAPPNGAELVVQAGERILFAAADGQVAAAIQIRYVGPAKDFGWILPLPSVPTLELSTDELFSRLEALTAPDYVLSSSEDDSCPKLNYQDAAPSIDGAMINATEPGPPIVVEQSSIGPYDYAVLNAEDKQALLAWLDANHYFVPVGTDDVVGPYIHKGAYFLALKLKSGASSGDLQPVVVRYASDLPMIPIELTSVTATANMPIWVWTVAAGRAIPRNYYHTVLDDAAIDWLNHASNYTDLVTRASREAPGRHTFVTEYAGPSSIMGGAVYWPGRFGSRTELAAQPNAVAFVDYVNQRGYATRAPYNYFFYTSALVAVLTKWLPPPPMYASLSGASFYGQLSYLARLDPASFVGWPASYEPAKIADDLDARIVQPTKAAQAILDSAPYLTRLFTTLSPEQMDRDPVFSFNLRLPNVPNVHVGKYIAHCSNNGHYTGSTLITADGWVIEYPPATSSGPPAVPPSRKIEIMTEELDPAPILDNDAVIAAALAPERPDAGGLDAPPPPDAQPGIDAPPPSENGPSSSGGCSVVGEGGGKWAMILLLAARFRRRRG